MMQNSNFLDNYEAGSTAECHSPLLNPHQVIYAASLTYIVYNTTHTPLLAIDWYILL